MLVSIIFVFVSVSYVLSSIAYVFVRMAYVFACITYVLLFTSCNMVDDNDFSCRRKVPCSHELQIFPLKNISLYILYESIFL